MNKTGSRALRPGLRAGADLVKSQLKRPAVPQIPVDFFYHHLIDGVEIGCLL